jgi:hypothetical protein
MNIPDNELDKSDSTQVAEHQYRTHLSCAIHLFKLARMNSEIKYITHSVYRDPPTYAYPPVTDILQWQCDMIGSLGGWLSEIPQGNNDDTIATFCRIRYHETMILLLRPSPGIPDPSDESLDLCFRQAINLLGAFDELYKGEALLYSRLILHSIFFGSLVMVHCLWKLPSAANQFRIDEPMNNFNISLKILSSIGEHWAEANRARDCVDELSKVTIQRLLNSQRISDSVSSTPRVSRLRSRVNHTGHAETGGDRGRLTDSFCCSRQSETSGYASIISCGWIKCGTGCTSADVGSTTTAVQKRALQLHL